MVVREYGCVMRQHRFPIARMHDNRARIFRALNECVCTPFGDRGYRERQPFLKLR